MVVEPGREGTHDREPRHSEPARGCFGATRDHYVCIPDGDEARRVSESVSAGGTCRDHGMIGTAIAMGDRNDARGFVDQASRDKIRGHTSWSAFMQLDRVVGNAGKAANARSQEYSRALKLGLVGYVPTGVGDSLLRGGQGEQDELIVTPYLFGR